MAFYQVGALASGSAMPAPAPSGGGGSMPSGRRRKWRSPRTTAASITRTRESRSKLAADVAKDAKERAKVEDKAKKEYEKALKDFKSAASNSPQMYQAYNGMGFSYRKTGDYAKALEMYDKALTLKPGFPDAIEYRGEAYLGLNRVDDAKQAYLEILAADRKQADTLMAAMQKWIADRRRPTRPASIPAVVVWAGDLDERARRDRQGDGGDGHEPRPALVVPFDDLVERSGRGPGARRAAGLRPLRSPPPPPDTPFEWRLPRGLPLPEVPADNPMTTVKVALGRRLFYDTRFSGNGTFACASCHQQEHAFTDGRPRAIGSTGQSHARSAMSLTNVAYNSSFGWADPGRADARGADVGADVQRASDRAWDCRARSGDRARGSRRAADTPWFAAAFPGRPAARVAGECRPGHRGVRADAALG